MHLGPRAVAWISSEIDQWIDERVKERDQKLSIESSIGPVNFQGTQLKAILDLKTGFLRDKRLGKRELKVLIAIAAHKDRRPMNAGLLEPDCRILQVFLR